MAFDPNAKEMRQNLRKKKKRLKYLEKQIRKAPGWGAAVGTMEEEAKSLRSSIAWLKGQLAK